MIPLLSKKLIPVSCDVGEERNFDQAWLAGFSRYVKLFIFCLSWIFSYFHRLIKSPFFIVQSAEKSGGRSKSIASFFSKRCLPPPDCKSLNLKETSPVSSVKSGSDVQGQQGFTYSK